MAVETCSITFLDKIMSPYGDIYVSVFFIVR